MRLRIFLTTGAAFDVDTSATFDQVGNVIEDGEWVNFPGTSTGAVALNGQSVLAIQEIPEDGAPA